jgi:hypothetical protein
MSFILIIKTGPNHAIVTIRFPGGCLTGLYAAIVDDVCCMFADLVTWPVAKAEIPAFFGD